MLPLFLIIWLVSCGLVFLFGLLLTGEPIVAFLLLIVWAIVSGILLVLLWAILTISTFFGIPFVVVIAVVIVAWFLLGRIRR